MRFLYCIILAITFLLLSCQEEKSIVIESYEDGTKKVEEFFNSGGIKTKQIDYYPSGQKKLEFDYKDSMRHGKFKGYSESGEIISVANYSFGLKQDTAKDYYENGILKNIRFYENGKMKIYRKFDKLGRKTTEINSFEDKILVWHKNGQLKAIIPNINGEYVEYYENGKMNRKGQIIEGKLNGEVEVFDSNEILEKILIYRNDTLVDSIRKSM